MLKFLNRVLLKTVRTIVGACALVCIAVGASGVITANKLLTEKPFETVIEEIRSNEWYVPIDQINKTFLDAIVSVEDNCFYDHNGINIKSILRAVKTNLEKKEFAEGGSTISQQLVKNMYLSQKKTITRKIQEAIITIQLEKKYSKEEILELYVNIIYYGNNSYGIGQAANKFYGKTPLDIDFNEATWLAGMPQAPSIYSKEEYIDRGKERQAQVINAMIKFDSSYKREWLEFKLEN